MKEKIDKNWWKSFALMLFSVITMGFCVSLLVLTKMGTDPCSAMNYGVARKLHLSFGNYQLIFNAILLIFVIIKKRSLIGTGTLGNMVVVGYTADFFSYVWKNLAHIPANLPLHIRLILLFPTLIIFVIAAACYMNSGHGMAPYDAFPFIITEDLEKKTKKTGLFKPVRLLTDFTATLIGFIFGGEVGLMTILMIALLAPTVDFVGKKLKPSKDSSKS